MSTNPIVTANILSADTGVPLNAHKVLVLGQKLAGGSATAGVLQTNIISETQINSLFGRKSHIAKKLRAVLKNLSISRKKPQIDAIALSDDGASVKASGTFTFTGTATESGIIEVYIDSKINGKYSISVVSGDTADVIGGKLATLVNANLDANYTASNATGTVTITAENGGTNGNQIRLGFDGEVAGITLAKSANYLGSGATDPSLTGLFDAIDGIQYQTIDYPSVWDLSTLSTLTEARFNVDNEILYSQGFTFKIDTYANLDTLLDGLNEKTICVGFSKLGGGIFENPDVINSQFCAYRGLLFTEGSNVTSLNAGNGQNEGSIRWASIPYFNMPFINLPVIPQGEGFTEAERQELEASGGWTFENNNSNTTLLTRAVKTTYKTNELGNADATFIYLNRMDSLTIAREYHFNGIKTEYPKHTMTNASNVPAGAKAFVTKGDFIATMVGFYNDLVEIGIFEGDREAEYAEYIADSLDFDLLNGKIIADAIAPITSQVREVTINFLSVIS